MRSKRGFFASLGAATSLILAGTLALASVSAVIAFRGWPGVHDHLVLPPATLLASSVHAEDRANAAATPITVSSAPVTPHRTHAPAHKVAHAPAPARHIAAAAPLAGTPAHVPSSPVGSAVKPAPAGSKPAPAPAPRKSVLGKTVTKVGDGLGSTVQGTGDALGNVVAPLSPALSQVVTDATDVVGGVVRKATAMVGQILNAVLPGHRAAGQARPSQPHP